MVDVADEHSLRKKRWRLALGSLDEPEEDSLTQQEVELDTLLEKIYPHRREGGLQQDRRFSAKWFKDIREHFPKPLVQVIQKDLIDRLGLRRMLKDPAVVEDIQPDINLVATILTLKDQLPPEALNSARRLVAKLADELTDKLRFNLINTVSGRRNYGQRTLNPRFKEIDWDKTIRENLKYYQPSLKTIIPVKLLGLPRSRRSAKTLIILVDQSASMIESYIFACVISSVLASIPSLKTHLIIFDTDVVDLTEDLDDPVALLFKAQLGGGTDIQRALAYAAKMDHHGNDTCLLLISDLFEGASPELLFGQVESLVARNIRMVNLLALDDSGVPAYDHEIAKHLSVLGVPSLACTPNQFPAMIAGFLNGDELNKSEFGLP